MGGGVLEVYDPLIPDDTSFDDDDEEIKPINPDEIGGEPIAADTYCDIIVNGEHVTIDTDYTWFKVTWDGDDGYAGTLYNETSFWVTIAKYAPQHYGADFPVVTVYDKNNNIIAKCGSYGGFDFVDDGDVH